MIAKVTISAAAVLVATSFARTDAMARGFGSFHHNAAMGAFHAPGLVGVRQGGSKWGRMAWRGFRPHDSDSHHGDPHGKNEHDADGRNGRSDGDHGHNGHSDGDHWRQSSRFGEAGRRSSNVVGEWHRSPGFGDSRRRASDTDDGQWHVDRE